MLFDIYKSISIYGLPVWKWLIKRRVKTGKEDSQRTDERFGIATHDKPIGKKLVWIHAASIGEVLSITPLIEHYADQQIAFVVTTQTRTSANVIQNRYFANVLHQYAPVDHPECIEAFLTHWQPDVCIRVESELWPQTLLAINRRSIPNLLINARLSERSVKRWRMFKKDFYKLCMTFNCICTQNDVVKERFLTLAPALKACLKTTGNMKYGVSPLEVDTSMLATARRSVRGNTVWLAASTHAGEEEIVIETHKILLKTHPHTLTILVPRHPERAHDIAVLCQRHGMEYALRSQEGTAIPRTGIYIADTLGEMGLWYRLSPVSLIGGSLVPGIGGHNLLEAAQLGTAVISGPYVRNAQEDYDRFWKEQAAVCVRKTEHIVRAVVSVWEGKKETARLVENALDIMNQSTSIVESVVYEIDKFLQTTAPRTPAC